MKSIKEQLRRVPQHGLSFGLLRYLSQDSPSRGVGRSATARNLLQLFRSLVFTLAAKTALFAPAAESMGPPTIHTVSAHTCSTSIAASSTGNYTSNGPTVTICTDRSTIERLAHFYLEALQALIAPLPVARSRRLHSFRLPRGSPDSNRPRYPYCQLALKPTTTGEVKRTRPNIEAIYPLSPMQEGMLFHRLYDPQSEVYFEQIALHSAAETWMSRPFKACLAAGYRTPSHPAHPLPLGTPRDATASRAPARQSPLDEHDWRNLSSARASSNRCRTSCMPTALRALTSHRPRSYACNSSV